jgi:hypothetical protein
VRLRHHRIEVGERSEGSIDPEVVTDVIAEIEHRRSEERRQPDTVDAETGNVVEPLQHARKVADAVAIAVLEAARVDLVQGGAAPPLNLLHDRPLLGNARTRSIGDAAASMFDCSYRN